MKTKQARSLIKETVKIAKKETQLSSQEKDILSQLISLGKDNRRLKAVLSWREV